MSDQTNSPMSWTKIRLGLGLAALAVIVALALQAPEGTSLPTAEGVPTETQSAPAAVPQPAETPAASPAASGAQFF